MMDAEERLALIADVANDRAFDAIFKVGEAILDHYYPSDVFDGSSGDAGPEYVVALRKAIARIRGMQK
jgi:hypothetical protein